MDYRVVMVCRSEERGERARRSIVEQYPRAAVDLLLADMSSAQSIKALVHKVRSKYRRLDVLVNNAGGYYGQREETVDGLEYTFGLNHMGYFRLTNGLLPLLKKSRSSRIVNVSSAAHAFADIDFDDLQSDRDRFRPWIAYGRSKLMNILFTKELNRRLSQKDGVTVNCLHPGFVRTGFGRNATTGIATRLLQLASTFLAISPEKGADTLVYLATSDEVDGVSGQYFVSRKPRRPRQSAEDPETAMRLWKISEKLA